MVGAEINRRGLDIPRVQLGAVCSDDLFEAREQAIFDFYERNRERYRRAADLGANVGIHAILMAKQGWDVRAFEPDPAHYDILVANATRNGVQIAAVRAAVSTQAGEAAFVRVFGNTTANHLAGARRFHGPSEQLRVPTVDCREIFAWADFAKIDVEGSEAALLCAVKDEKCEFMVEIGTADAAGDIFIHFKNLGRPMYAQRLQWGRVTDFTHMPWCYQDGSLFIGERP